MKLSENHDAVSTSTNCTVLFINSLNKIAKCLENGCLANVQREILIVSCASRMKLKTAKLSSAYFICFLLKVELILC